MVDETKKEEYAPSPLHKHFNPLIWEEITTEGPQENRSIRYRKWLFDGADFQCGFCGNSGENIQFMALATGVFISCKDDGYTQKIPSIGEDGKEARMLENRIIDQEEMREVLERNGMFRTYFKDNPINIPDTKFPTKNRRTKKK